MEAVHLFHTTGNVTCTVTGQGYASLLELSIIPALHARRCDTSTVFMQDGALPHIAHCVKQLLSRHFCVDKIISQQCPTAWLPRSPDLNRCDFWLRGYIKAMVYRDLITSLSDLKESIERHLCNIPQFMVLSTVEYAILRLDNIEHHIEHVS